jgi:hypothetical protein
VESILSRNCCIDFAAMITLVTKGLAKSRLMRIKLTRMITAAAAYNESAAARPAARSYVENTHFFT